MTTTLARAVANATGESVSTIRRMGFNLVGPVDSNDDFDAFSRPQMVNWDELDAERHGYLAQRGRHRRKSA
jgi:hypothetical protein